MHWNEDHGAFLESGLANTPTIHWGYADDLIKERKKEVKTKKLDSVKKETTHNPKKNKDQQSQNAKKTRSEMRKALVNKNRGLPALVVASNGSNNSRNANATQTTKRSKVAEKGAAKQVVNANAPSRKSVRKVTSPKSNGNQVQQPKPPQKKMQKPQQQKVQQKQSVQPQQKQKQKQSVHVKGKASNAGKIQRNSMNDRPRKVVRSANRAANIRITIKQPQPASNRQQTRNSVRKANIMNVVLPGKVSRNFSKTTRVQKVIQRVQNRKQTSKNGNFVVRKPFVSKPKN